MAAMVGYGGRSACKNGKIVAVKIPKDITREDRQLAEGKELLDVEPHENIVQIFDMGRIDNEWFYIEMEYFPSQTLARSSMTGSVIWPDL
jgi:serine/threonine-protein kinase